MEVISLFESERRDYWTEQMGKCDWDAGQLLHRLIVSGEISRELGEGAKVLLLTDGDELISFCTYAKLDDIQPTDLTPWMGFVFTRPEHRGHRYIALLMEEVEKLAREEGISEVYISTSHVGLYEKYGCELKTKLKDMNGELSRVYVKKIESFS